MTKPKFTLIVSHPARQQSIYQWPLAAHRRGIPVKFLTGLYYRSEKFPYFLVKFLPQSRRAALLEKLEKRRVLELDQKTVSISGPWFELIFRPFKFYRAWNLAYDWLASRWIKYAFKPEGPTILHCFQDTFGHTIRAARRKGMITLMEITLPPSTPGIVAAEYERLGLPPGKTLPPPEFFVSSREVDYLIAQSRFSVESLLEYGVPPHKIILQPMGVDTEKFYPNPTKDLSQPFRVLFVGQLDLRKGLQHLLEAWTQLNLPNAELILIGLPVNKSGVALLKKYEGAYRWPGFVPDAELRQTYRDSDVFAFPSLAEGGSNVVYEALASGLPCLVSTNAGSAVRDGIEGFVIPVGDVESLKERLKYLYLNPDLRRQMALAAREQAERFTWEQFSRRLDLMYNHILNGKQKYANDFLDMTDC